MIEQEFTAGHIFFRPGDRDELAYLLTEGQVEVLAGAPEDFVQVGLFKPGEVFGEMALIQERPRALTARAVTAGRANAMTRDEFEHLLTHDPGRARQYLSSIFERLRTLTNRLSNVVGPVRAETPASLPEISIAQGATKSTSWVVVIHPLSRKAAQTLPDECLLATRFPLRIGRASAENESEAFDLNDVWLLDVKPYNVSRNHCELLIDRDGPLVRDRGSHLGCYVNDELVGGRNASTTARLTLGDNVLVVGSRMSPYQFRVHVSQV